jgi:hypothetical protein
MRIMAIDPGEKVGWATCEYSEPKIGGVMLKRDTLKHGITDLKSFALRIAEVYPLYDVVVMESFRLSAAKARELSGSTLPTVQFIGMIRLLSWQNPKVMFEEQGPSTKKTALKTMQKGMPKWYEFCTQPGAHDETHDQDAVMHLWHWFWRHYV